MSKPRVIVCAAVRSKTSHQKCHTYLGPRHFDETMCAHMSNGRDTEQGFIDQFGVFLTREEAYEVAKAAGQIKYRCPGDEGRLFSENLY